MSEQKKTNPYVKIKNSSGLMCQYTLYNKIVIYIIYQSYKM